MQESEQQHKAHTPHLEYRDHSLVLANGDVSVNADFTRLLRRCVPHRLSQELVVKATRLKGVSQPAIIDATAGLGDDAFLLAASGATVTLYERNPIIAQLLRDAVTRAGQNPRCQEAICRIQLIEADSIIAMKELAARLAERLQGADTDTETERQQGTGLQQETNSQQEASSAQEAVPAQGAVPIQGANSACPPAHRPDVIYLDPMFPTKQKSAIAKKKLQLLQQLESPSLDEDELFAAAMAVQPRKIVVKRPVKGPYLSGQKPSYSLTGTTIRYDCYVHA